MIDVNEVSCMTVAGRIVLFEARWPPTSPRTGWGGRGRAGRTGMTGFSCQSRKEVSLNKPVWTSRLGEGNPN